MVGKIGKAKNCFLWYIKVLPVKLDQHVGRLKGVQHV